MGAKNNFLLRFSSAYVYFLSITVGGAFPTLHGFYIDGQSSWLLYRGTAPRCAGTKVDVHFVHVGEVCVVRDYSFIASFSKHSSKTQRPSKMHRS